GMDARPNRRSILTWMLAAAATAVLAVSGTLTLAHRGQDKGTDGEMSSTVPAAAPSAPIAANGDQPHATPGPPAPVRPRAAQGPAVAMVQLPQMRSIASIPTLAIPAGVDRVTFELRLEANDFSEYRAGLQDPATSQIVWRSGWIAAKST